MNGDTTDIIAEQTPRFLEVLNNIRSETDKVSVFVTSLHSALSDEGALESQSEGISLLSLKSHLLLDYVINLAKLILHRLEGKPLSLMQSDVIKQMVRERVVLEKIKPLEMKTKYQIDKLVTLATTGFESMHRPLSYKPNPSNLMPREEGLSLGNEGDAGGVYRPPRISAAPGIVGSAGEVREEGRDRDRRRALQSSLIRELREEVGDTPQEIFAREDARSARVAERVRERERYEEDNFMRLTVSKKQRRQEKITRSEMESIMDFGRTEFSEDGNLEVRGQRPRGDRKRKASGRAKRKKH